MADDITNSPPATAQDTAEFDAYVQTIGQEVTSGKQAIESATDFTQRRFALDRSYIVYIVIGAWAIVILLHIWFVMDAFPEITCKEGVDCAAKIAAWREPSKYILDSITQLVLPIVTLVIGYYFGTQKTEGRE